MIATRSEVGEFESSDEGFDERGSDDEACASDEAVSTRREPHVLKKRVCGLSNGGVFEKVAHVGNERPMGKHADQRVLVKGVECSG